MLETRVRPMLPARDPRWPLVVAQLAALREKGRFAVRVVDADCGSGALLLRALRHARALGFLAIEGRGIDRSPARIARARAVARLTSDPAVGVTFEAGDCAIALRGEHDLPADILLWHGTRPGDAPGLALAAIRAARALIDDAGTREVAA